MVTINAVLDLLGPCNYSCHYCIGDGKPNPYPVPVLHDLRKLTKIYQALGRRGSVATTLNARGTEPAIHPQTASLARICAPPGTFLCSTNLSKPVGEWLGDLPNIQLLVTIHPEAEADLPGFMDRIRDAVEQGYDVRVQALGPEDRPDWRAMIEEAGVTQPFYVRVIRVDSRWKAQNTEIVQAAPGSLCRAGYDSCFITPQTKFLRCRVKDWPGGPYDAPAPCPQPQADSRCEAYLV